MLILAIVEKNRKIMIKKYIYISTFLTLFCAFNSYANVNIAVVAPQSGSRATFGQELWEGAKIAVDEINSNGGLLGKKLNLIMVDDRCDDRFAISTAQMISLYNYSKGKTSLVIGAYCNNSFVNVAETYAKAQIFQIVPTPLNSTIGSCQHQGLIKMTGYLDQQGDAFYNYCQENFSNKKIGVVIDSRISGIQAIGEGVKQHFISDGKEAYLSMFDFATYGDDYEKLAEKMEEEHVQVAYILGDDDAIAELVKEWKDINSQAIVFTDIYMARSTFQDVLGKNANGTYMFSLPTLKDNPEFTETLVKLRLLGIEPKGLSVYGYSAIRLWEELVKEADSFDYKDLAETTKNEKIDIGWGKTGFSKGIPDNTVGYRWYRFVDGEYTQVD